MAETDKKDRKGRIIFFLGIFCLLAFCCGAFFSRKGQENMERFLFPLTDYADGRGNGFREEFFSCLLPLLAEQDRDEAMPFVLREDEEIRQSSGNAELEELQTLMEQEQLEERRLRQNLEEDPGLEDRSPQGESNDREGIAPEVPEDNTAAQRFTDFTPHEKAREVSWEEMGDYESLVKNFYIIDPSTMAGSNQLKAETFLAKDLTIEKDPDAQGPQILIYHTHSQEGFSDSIAGDPETSIMAVGEELTRILTRDYGYQVLHHTGEYDKKTRDDAYSKALPEIEEILQENPSIQVVIDLHRDEVPEGTRLVQEIDGKPTARFMFFNGLSRTKKTGNLDYLYNVYQEENLAFSFQMQLRAMEYYPGLTRKIYLKGYRYNMHLCPRTLLIELGAQNNTLEEAMNACGPLAHILDLVLSGEKQETSPEM